MRSTAISPDRLRPALRTIRQTLAAALLACALAVPGTAAAMAAAMAADWPSELGPVLSWTPPTGATNPGRCSRIVDRDRDTGASIQAAVDAAGPGEMVCVRSTDHRDEVVEVRSSGFPGRPLQLVALAEVVTGGFVVEADDVVIRGFTVETGAADDAEDWRAGFALRGRRLGIIDNTITEPAGYGIHCSLGAPHCTDTAIIGNTVSGADGNGINAVGYDILVEGNDVSGSIRRYANDADGIRFFGERLLLRDNFIHRIFDRGYAGEGPHTDCFQSFDSGRPSTRGVVIEDNVCFDVDHQCLIIETPVRREGGDVVFRRNICANNGSQGLMLRELDSVLVEENIFLSTIYYNAVVLRQEVADATIRCNLVVGRPAVHEIDKSSRRGLQVTGNQRAASPAEAPAARAALERSGCNLPPLDPWLEESVMLASETGDFADGERRP